VRNQNILHFKHLQTLTVKALQTLANKSEIAWQSWCRCTVSQATSCPCRRSTSQCPW
jgi:hypothetical protein